MKFTIDVDIPDRWVDSFCSFLKKLERNGKIGRTERVVFYCDGDGDFRPTFDINADYNLVKGINTCHYITDNKPIVFLEYDADYCKELEEEDIIND